MSSILLKYFHCAQLGSRAMPMDSRYIIGSVKESVLVNTLGHAAGVLIFGIFLVLLIQDRAARRLRGGAKPMLAAALALVWNLASLLVLGFGARIGSDTIAFSVLSLLPAVLFDLCLAGRHRRLVLAGYGLSSVAIALHVAELFKQDPRYHRWGLTLMTIGFVALTCLAAGAVWRDANQRDANRRAATSRLISTMSLFLLAISFVHFGGAHAQQVWSRELAFHHAAIPLALLVLLQDYRFVLLDAFLRFLANVFLAALFVSGAAAAWKLGRLHGTPAPFDQALFLAGACLLLIAFALLRTRVQALLTRLLFRRKDVEALLRDLKQVVREEQGYIESAAARLGEFVGAQASVNDPRQHDLADLDQLELRRPMLTSEFSRLRAALETHGIEVVLPIRLPSRGTRYILLGRRSGGRRYLSEDLAALSRAVSVILEQIELYRESEMRRLAAQAELRALQSQIHPHFLFNALNALYGIIPREAKGARETVLNLADIFRYFLETRKTYLPLKQELNIVRAYLEIERLRLGPKLRIEIDVPEDAVTTPIPVLSIQPLVENAVKHGIAPRPEGGLVRIEARHNASGDLEICVSDTGGGFAQPGDGGIGLENVARRLELCYGAEARLDIQSGAEGTAVSFSIPASSITPFETMGAAV
jgi:two-component system, LytTR family, sensor kinase